MSIVRLIYVSRMTEACDTVALHKILEISREKNVQNDITGILCYDPQYFLQCLEGPQAAVNELYANIARDDRHARVTLLEYRDAEQRHFGDWSMAFLAPADMDPATVRKFSESGKFDPYRLTSDRALAFLTETAAQKRDLLASQADAKRA